MSSLSMFFDLYLDVFRMVIFVGSDHARGHVQPQSAPCECSLPGMAQCTLRVEVMIEAGS
jgi:hypothetical protein